MIHTWELEQSSSLDISLYSQNEHDYKVSIKIITQQGQKDKKKKDARIQRDILP